MANHPKFKAWQDKIKLMRAQNATASAPPAIKKDVEDQIKLLETTVNKFNTCYGNFPKQWQQLEELESTSAVALESLTEAFDAALGDDAQRYRDAIAAVDAEIDEKVKALDALRGGPAAEEPKGSRGGPPFASIPEAEQALNALKEQLTAGGPDLKQVETLCDVVGKWGADAAKARKDAEGIAPGESPIDAWTAINALGAAYNALVERLNGNPTDDATATLAARFNELPALLAKYRAVGQDLERLRNDLKTGEAALEEMRKSRSDRILLEFENPTPIPLPDPDGDGGDDGNGGDDEGDTGDETPVGATRTSTPHMRGEGQMWGDTGAGEE